MINDYLDSLQFQMPEQKEFLDQNPSLFAVNRETLSDFLEKTPRRLFELQSDLHNDQR